MAHTSPAGPAEPRWPGRVRVALAGGVAFEVLAIVAWLVCRSAAPGEIAEVGAYAGAAGGALLLEVGGGSVLFVALVRSVEGLANRAAVAVAVGFLGRILLTLVEPAFVD